MFIYLYFPLHFLPIPNTYALTFMAHVFLMLLFSAFIWFEFALNEVNFAQPNSSSYKICHKWPDLAILYREKKSVHTTQLYLETDVLLPLKWTNEGGDMEQTGQEHFCLDFEFEIFETVQKRMVGEKGGKSTDKICTAVLTSRLSPVSVPSSSSREYPIKWRPDLHLTSTAVTLLKSTCL